MELSSSDSEKLNVQVYLGNWIVIFAINPKTTVGKIMAKIESIKGIPSREQRLFFEGRRLESHERFVDCGVKNGNSIDVYKELVGGGFINLKDLEGEVVTGSGKPIDPDDVDTWKAFSFGFNIIGKCDNGDCKSNKIRIPPMLNQGSSHVRLTGDDTLDCPACECKTFKPANFLVAGARSAINFRKKGEIKTKSILLESPGPFPEYAKFAESNDAVEYDEIEVKTSILDGSPFFCNLCTTFIMRKSEEACQPCGHHIHKTCADEFKNCPICSSEVLIGESVEKLFKL